MVSKIISISVTNEDFEYIKSDGLLKPSAIFRSALNNIKESREELKEQIKTLQIKCKILQEKLFELQENDNAQVS